MFGISIWWVAGGVALLALVGIGLYYWLRKPTAYVYIPEGVAMAQFRYQDIPLHACDWCGKSLSVHRHHCIAWCASPELKDDPNNIVMLCGNSCHKVIGHGNNYHRFNANIKETLKTAKWVTSDEYYRETHGGKDRTEIRR